MNYELLKKEIELYKNCKENNQEAFDDRAERIAYYKFYDKDKLLKITEEDFVEYIGKLWASNMYGNKKYLVNKMIDSNGGYENLLKILSEFLFGVSGIEKRWDKFYKECKFFGPSSMSELLAYLYPDDFALMNSQVIKALSYLGYDKLPHYNYQYTGKNYIKVCDIVKELKNELIKVGIECENLLAVDYFLWEVADHAVEVQVAKGAKVDAVWSVNIGNMGRVIYVFEVQTKGSIDSLILNLQKAANNKAVQAVVAVSDEKQLIDIKNESEPLHAIDIKLWNYESVNEVFENLSKASDVINKLGLVPQDFNK